MERTLVLIKPDGVQRGLVGTVITRLEGKGLQLVAMKMIQVSKELATQHYVAHRHAAFFTSLVEFITSSPTVALVVQGPKAVKAVRDLMGDTNPLEARIGTIRGDLGFDISRNLVHGSDSTEAADREIDLFFTSQEVLDYRREVEPWITES